jgi:hypothetical protein
MTDCPYSFTATTRAEMIEYLTRDGRYYRPYRYRFAWNVKVHGACFDGPTLRALNPDLSPEYDARWTEWMERNGDGAFWYWCEEAARWYAEGDWCSYPGDDQGDWQFAFEGRSGGWLVLTKWRNRDMRDFDPAELTDPEEWPDDDLTDFYRGIVCLDTDVTPDKAAREVEYHAMCYRDTLEAEWREEAEQAAEEMAAAIAEERPDLAPAY